MYFDNNATTHPFKQAIAVSSWGNPGSKGAVGVRAHEDLEEARRSILEHFGLVGSHDLVFTSGATESNNLIISGFPGDSVSFLETDHESVRAPMGSRGGRAVGVLKRHGVLDLANFFPSPGGLFSFSLVNHETGTLQPWNRILNRVHGSGGFVHCDATQGIGRLLDPPFWRDFDYISCSAHKFHGPMGVGFLFISKNSPKLRPLSIGGTQEGGLRPGTPNLPGILGSVIALRLLDARAYEASSRLLRKAFVSDGRFVINGFPSLGGILNILGPVDHDVIVGNLAKQGISVGTGSACASKGISESLLALGLSESEAKRAIRISVSQFTTGWEIGRLRESIVREFEK